MTNEEKIQQVRDDEAAELDEIDNTYGVQDENGNWNGGLIGDSISQYEDATARLDEGKAVLEKAANDALNQTISEINQSKEYARQDYVKEQSGAYADWQKQSNAYGVNAEKMAASGLTGSGYAESSQVSMYNTYQNRVATARASYDRTVTEYENAIAEAKAQNSSALAQIAYDTLQQKLSLSLEAFQYKNNLILEAAQAKSEVKNTALSQYLSVLDRINTEDAQGEDSGVIEKETGGEGDGTVGYAPSVGENVAVGYGALTKKQWTALRDHYLTTGIGAAAVMNYESYEDYSRDFMAYKKS